MGTTQGGAFITARNARTISFSDHHDQVIDKIAAELQIPVAEAVRILIEKGLDAAPDVRLAYLISRRNELQSSLDNTNREIDLVEKVVADHPLAVVGLGMASKKRMELINPPEEHEPLCGHDEFAHFLTRLGSGGVLGRAAEKKVRAHLNDHPEWVPEVPTEWQHLFIVKPPGNGGQTV